MGAQEEATSADVEVDATDLSEEEQRLKAALFARVMRQKSVTLEQLKDDSLDHIARRMADIERRLDLGRAGPKTREVEDGVIASLDKLIEEIEKQQQQQAGAAAAAAAPSMPAQDSRPMEGKGPGEITPRAIGSQSGWGDLPPKDREEALQQIGQQFPAHYRDAIEQYFRRSAQTDQPAATERPQ